MASIEQKDRIAVVTGGAGSLGRAVVRMLHSTGVTIAVPVHGKPVPLAWADFSLETDLADEGSCSAFFGSTLQRYGRIDYLINLAGGYVGGKRVEETSPEDLLSMFRLNVLTAQLSIRFSLPSMLKEHFGRIVTVAAKPALVPSTGRSAYAIAKGAVVTLTEAVAAETRGTGVTCNAVAPSILLTPGNSSPAAETSGWVSTEEIAALIHFLCSHDARSISGNTIRVFGGVE